MRKKYVNYYSMAQIDKVATIKPSKSTQREWDELVITITITIGQ